MYPIVEMAYPYWPGDVNVLNFQTLDFNPVNNELTITPFGNTVSLNTQVDTISSLTVSSINGVSFPSYANFIPVQYEPGFQFGSGNIDSNSPLDTPIANFSTIAGRKYRISLSPTFLASAPSATDFVSIVGFSAVGPNDTIIFCQANASWYGYGNTPGLAGNAGGAYSGIMTAQTSNYTIYGDMSLGATVSTTVTFSPSGITVEQLN